MRHIASITVVALFVLSGCGGDGGGGDDSSGSLNPAFSGAWTGTATISFDGLSPVSYYAYLTISVSGGTATVAKLCPTGSGSLVVSGNDNYATWHGTLTCPPSAFRECDPITVVYQSGTATLSGGALTVTATGYGTGCGVTRSATVTFIGTR